MLPSRHRELTSLPIKLSKTSCALIFSVDGSIVIADENGIQVPYEVTADIPFIGNWYELVSYDGGGSVYEQSSE